MNGMPDFSKPDAAVFERAVEAAGHAIYMTNRDGTITYVNPAFEETTGYAAEEVIGRTPAILDSGEHPDEYFERLWETILAGEVWEEEIVNRCKDGKRYTAHQTITPIVSNDENDGFVAIQTDITQQKQNEQQLRQYEQAIEGSHDLICATDRTDRYLFANPRYCAFHGIERDGATDLTLADVFDDEEYRSIKQRVDRVLQGESVEYQMTRTRSTEGERTFDIRYSPLEDRDGEIHGVVATMRDVTNLVARTEKLKRNRNLLTQTERLTEVGGWELDFETETLRWTEGTHHIHDVSTDYDPDFEDGLEFFHPDSREKVEQAIEHCLNQEGLYDIEARLVTADERNRCVRITGECSDQDGKTVLRGAIKDITDQKQREQRLMVLNRVLRHNVRNDLTIVMGHAELLEEELAALEKFDTPEDNRTPSDIIAEVRDVADLPSSLQSELSTIERLIDQISSFPFETALIGTQQIQESSKRLVEITEKAQTIEQIIDDDQLVERVAVRPIVEEVAATCREEFPDASVEVVGEEASVLGNRAAIHRIVDELLENALKHSDQDPPTATIRVQMEGSDTVTIHVEDTGPGIPEMERQTIREGEETPLIHSQGIGLWLISWLVTHLSGTVTIEENDPRGTIVKVRLPQSD